MKTKIIIGLLMMFICCISSTYAQITLPLLTTGSNINKDMALIDHPQLNGNSEAIILVTTNTDKFGNQYPSPLGIRYMPDNKWYVINTDQNKMQPGKTFVISFWANPNPTHFVHRVVARGNSANLKNGTSRIDNPALNNNSGASVKVFPMRSYVSGDTVNDNAPSPKYNEAEKKWYIESTNGKEIYEYNAFNIVIQNGGTKEIPNNPQNIVTPTSTPSTPQLGPARRRTVRRGLLPERPFYRRCGRRW